ncbi:MAG: phosphoribosylamine--glycine ligase [Thermoplasmatales archaeon]|nr:phosphoribosylamine--glycine ligase [Thermoplasmatales archaeon]
MIFLTVGGGGREHAAVEALHRSGAEIHAVMKTANPGIIALAKDYLLAPETDVETVCAYAAKVGAQFAFIGPEAPLEAGLVDALERQGVACAAPTANAARIETSKTFMRELVRKYGIEGNLAFASFNNKEEAVRYLETVAHEIVVKPVGLTGGKGVKVQGEHIHTIEDAAEYVGEIFSENIGGAGVIIEEKAVGEEFTLMVFCDGRKISPMPLVQDHKRAFEGDVGPNTGGMGSYSDADHLLPFVEKKDMKQALRILRDIVDAMAKEGCPYRGPMYGQFMLTVDGPKIIEINARFGDPEAMNVLPLLKSDFADVCMRMARGNLESDVEFSRKATVCKYVVPEGYGTRPVPGAGIKVDVEAARAAGAEVFFANVEEVGGKLVTGTSRSIGVVGIADTLEKAERNCEEALKHVVCDGCFVRHDIGKKELVQRRVDHMERLRAAHVD